LPEENRWDVYWDAPLSIPGAKSGNPNLPRRPEEVHQFVATFESTACEVTTKGARLEITFPGLSMGIFAGQLRYTIYRCTDLIRQELIAKTDEPSVAYKYHGGLKGFSTDQFGRIVWRDVGGTWQKYSSGGEVNQNPIALRARNRLAIAEGKD